ASAIGTGSNSYTFNPPFTINRNDIEIEFSPPIPVDGVFYLRWNLNTTGSNSQGIGIDDVIVVATFGDPEPPVVTGNNWLAIVGVDFSQTIQATNNPTSFVVSGGSLPSGLDLDEETGEISGTPTSEGIYAFE